MDFVDRYLACIGESAYPLRWHKWCALSLISASVKNNVYFELCPDDPIFPDLYIMLVGPAGLGKNRVIERAAKLAKRATPKIRILRGHYTAAGLMDELSGRHAPGLACAEEDMPVDVQQSYCEPSKAWLLMPELSYSIGEGDAARIFVKFMTELYSEDGMADVTRKHGRIAASDLNLVWLAATNPDWMCDSIRESELTGGFASRIITVIEDRDFNKRQLADKPPGNWRMLQDYLIAHIRYLNDLPTEPTEDGKGKFTMEPKALDHLLTWYSLRPAPSEIVYQAHWEREPLQIIKVSMLKALARDRCDYIITYDDLLWAMKEVSDVYQDLPRLVDYATKTYGTRKIDVIYDRLKSLHTELHVDWVPRTAITKAAHNRGILSKALTVIMRELIDKGLVGTKEENRVTYYRTT